MEKEITRMISFGHLGKYDFALPSEYCEKRKHLLKEGVSHGICGENKSGGRLGEIACEIAVR
jgi:hypothetical protein